MFMFYKCYLNVLIYLFKLKCFYFNTFIILIKFI